MFRTNTAENWKQELVCWPLTMRSEEQGDGDGGHHSVLLAGRRHGRMNRSAAYLMADGDARRRCVCSVLIEGWWPALDSSVS